MKTYLERLSELKKELFQLSQDFQLYSDCEKLEKISKEMHELREQMLLGRATQ